MFAGYVSSSPYHEFVVDLVGRLWLKLVGGAR